MHVRFWGTRGSIATPGPGTVRYGGNTSCVELRSSTGTVVVIDCGTGARALGLALVAESDALGRPTAGSILLGHTHWDHIQGLPFFAPLFQEGAHWDLYGPRGLGTSLAQTLAGQMEYQYFPVSVDGLGATVGYHDLVEGMFMLDDLAVRTQYLNHPALTLGYRIEGDGGILCYLADHEPFDPALAAGGDVPASLADRRHVELMAWADVVIHDAQYDRAEYAARVGWGHSTTEYVVDAAIAAEVGTVVLFHHDPGHDDDTVDALLEAARRRAAGRVHVVAAAEGDVIEVVGRGGAAPRPLVPSLTAVATPAVEELATSIVVLAHDGALHGQLVDAAGAEHLVVLDDADLERLSGRAVLVVEADDEGGEALERLRRTVDAETWSRLTVVGVSRTGHHDAPTPGITDWLVWPATVGHVRTKLRAAVLRRACRWLAAPTAPDEQDRLASLHRLGLLDTAPEARFDRLTDEAATSLGVPIALITLIDADRQWFKSHHGFEAQEGPRDESVCAHAILESDVLHVPDLLQDDRFADNPAVSGPLHARFYAGAPLVLDDGNCVGTLCVVDHRPRLLDPDQLDELRRLARAVVAELQATATA